MCPEYILSNIYYINMFNNLVYLKTQNQVVQNVLTQVWPRFISGGALSVWATALIYAEIVQKEADFTMIFFFPENPERWFNCLVSWKIFFVG